jgi:hypothetical protein
MQNQNDIRRIMEKILVIDRRLERYNKRMDRILKETNYLKGITYDELSLLRDSEYGQSIKFEYLE